MLHYNCKSYILQIFGTNLLEKNHDNSLANYFGVEKTFELFIYKYYRLKIKVYIEKYVQNCDICIKSKVQRHKPYGSL